MVYLEQLSEIVERLVAAEADNYLLTMVKYVIEKSQIPDREIFFHWVQTHLSPPLEYEDRVKNARPEDLLLWGERILDAEKTLDEVFEV